jgi:hypothetical protein
LTPPLYEHVPLPEFEDIVPLLHIEPAFASTNTKLVNTIEISATRVVLFIFTPLSFNKITIAIAKKQHQKHSQIKNSINN